MQRKEYMGEINDFPTYLEPIGLFGFDDFLISIYKDDGKVKIDYITSEKDIYTGILKAVADDKEGQRCIVKFFQDGNEDGSGDKLIIFPDRKTIDFCSNRQFRTCFFRCGVCAF